MLTLICSDCGNELRHNETFIYCPTCNAIDFTEQGEARFEKIANMCRDNNMSIVELRKAITSAEKQEKNDH